MRSIAVVLALTLLTTAHASPYQDPKAPVEKRIADLLKRMTLREKISQLTMKGADGLRVIDGKVPEEDLVKLFGSDSIGMLSADFYQDAVGNAIRFRAANDYLRRKSRLGIPALRSSEAVHGLMMAGATIYPQAIAMGATWNPDLVKRVANQISEEASAAGVDITLCPVLDLARDPRYGRVEECFGECPTLVSRMGVAYVTGMQGDDYRLGLDPDRVLCQIKHFAGYSVPYNGINIGPSSLGEREMRSLHLPSFEAVVTEAHAASVMPSYNEVDGIPAHANRWLLTDVLRNEWKFDGFVGSDWGGVTFNSDFHRVTDRESSGLLALEAGVDLEEPGLEGFANFESLVGQKKLKVKAIDQAVARVLRVKFRAGLFDGKRDIDPAALPGKLHRPDHVALAREAANESLILLKNEGNLLPLKRQRIAVIGPNADQVQFGDYCWSKSNKSGVTILRGIQESGADVHYAKGCDLVGLSTAGFASAVEEARRADVAIVVIGDTSMILSGVGWEDKTVPSGGTVGEGYDVSNPVPPGVQEDLVKAVVATGTPTVVVMLQGRTFCIPWIKKHAAAIVSAYYPGEEQGHAVADLLFGKIDPSGRLPVSVAQSAGHIPTVYDYKPSGRGYYHRPGTPENPGRDYVFSSPDPLWPFGFGLSYTTFAYSDLRIETPSVKSAETVKFGFKVTNTGSRTGKEVAQVYFRDRISSTTTPVKRLIRFAKFELGPGQSKTLSFEIPAKELALWNREMKRVVEPGDFDLTIGQNAEDVKLKGSFKVR